MQINYTAEKPIFLQIAEGLEDAILSGIYPEEAQIPSITELSVAYTINPATALKGINLLVDEGVLYKKRGVGMFVAAGALAGLREKRRQAFYRDYTQPLAAEAKRLDIEKPEALAMLEKAFDE